MTSLKLRSLSRPIVGSALLCAVVSVFIACSGDDSAAPPPSSGGQCSGDLASIQQTIFRPTCATNGCHAGAAPAGDLDLSGDTAPLLVGVPSALCQGATRVVPGVPSDSLLYRKIVGDSKCGLPMPLGGKLSAEQRTCIEDWILGLMGAPPADAGPDASDGPDASCEMCGGASCVDLQTDPLHCGACGAACAANLFCAAGVCSMDCGALTKCGGACANTATDSNNCGACGVVCTGDPCVNGVCGCGAGTSLCGGVCINTQTDAKNCGGCGNACAPGQTCSAGACQCGAASVSYAAAVQPILTMRCATNGCHAGVMPAQGLNLNAANSYSKLVNVAASECADGRKRVLPGQPSTSYLMDKLLGVDLCFGTVMPKMGMIPAAEIQTISDWICEGAPNN